MHVTILVVFAIVVALWLGKRVGERRSAKVQEQLQALELGFNQVLDQLELASNHNIRVMSGKTQECKELLPIIDQKILHFNDLMSEAEGLHRDLPAAARSLRQEITNGLKLRRDLEDLLGAIDRRITELRELQQQIEPRRREPGRGTTDPVGEGPSSTSFATAPGLAPFRPSPPPAIRPSSGGGRANDESRLAAVVAGSVMATGPGLVGSGAPATIDKIVRLKARDEAAAGGAYPALAADAAAEASFEQGVTGALALLGGGRSAAGSAASVSVLPAKPEPPERNRAAVAALAGSGRIEVVGPSARANLPPLPGDDPDRSGHELPEIGTNHRRVLDLHAEGVTAQQIASQLALPRGEVNLILQLYGQTTHLRRIPGG